MDADNKTKCLKASFSKQVAGEVLLYSQQIHSSVTQKTGIVQYVYLPR